MIQFNLLLLLLLYWELCYYHRYISRRLLLVDDELSADHTHASTSPALSSLIFTNYQSHSSAHLTHSLYNMKETSGMFAV